MTIQTDFSVVVIEREGFKRDPSLFTLSGEEGGVP
jgi:hypothetical protein